MAQFSRTALDFHARSSVAPVPSSARWDWFRVALLLFGLATICLAGAQRAWPKSTLHVYSSLEPDEVKHWTDRFNLDNPDIELDIVRSSTGTLTARLLAERSRPQADVIWRLSITSLILLDEQGMLQPYQPRDYEKLNGRFKDRNQPPAWVGHNGFETVVCFNSTEGKKLGIPAPSTWRDLTKPIYKGRIVMANPASSGVGFLNVSSWLQLFGADAAWKYMDALHENILFYVHSGSKPCNLAASGEVLVGLSVDVTAMRLKAKEAPIEIIFPSEGVGSDLEGSAILKGTKNLETAKRFMDWVISENALRLYNEAYPVIGRPELAKPNRFYPPDIAQRLIKSDLRWTATNRDRILKEWNARYDAKSEGGK
jgi:iron(III) transport system substrate-binding protein